ncbi:MAG: cupin domain-containing protein [Amaricoccus sp.]|uniref:cupin domain-containing protein n=1 Tax=Amaricoccus sp. TaxID=1872485 RepID=UPI0033160CB5
MSKTPPAWLLPGPFPAEFPTEERCFITELMNDPACPEVSLALARVAPGVTTRLHHLLGTVERYVIQRGAGLVEIDGLSAFVAAGDRVLIPAGAAQRITNTGENDLVFQCVCAPRFRPENYVDLGD